MFFYTYILKSLKDGKKYTGFTKNLKLRFEQHNNGLSQSTKTRGPFKLIYYEACLDKKDAMKREKYLKTHFGKMFIKNRLKSYLTGGFTLIETLVAVTILSAAVAGPMVLAIKNIGLASVSQDQLVAFYLGQEVMEYARNVRDTNLINGSSGWLTGLSVCNGANGSVGCYIDVINDTVNDCGTSACPKLNFNSNSNYYNYQPVAVGNEGTNFTRTVKINNSVRADGDETKIDVVVSWTGKYGTKTMNLQDNIFNWR